MQIHSISLLVVAAVFAQSGCEVEGPVPSPETASEHASEFASAVGAQLVPECTAQRAVHIVAGAGSLGWFTQVWPAPAVITDFQPAYAYDAPTRVKAVGTEASHPLYARLLGTRALWEGRGIAPQPSVFVAGRNEVATGGHTAAPGSIAVQQGTSLAAAGAALQASLQPVLPVLVFSPAGPYVSSVATPAAVTVANVDAAVAALTALVTPAQAQLLRPSASQLARYVPLDASAGELALASRLAFTANALGLGLVGTVVMPGTNDDPHNAFDVGVANVTTRANRLATTLDAFYADLALFREPSCVRAGAVISIANNTVMTVLGDTPKNSFNRAGWADGTLGLSNWMYLRSNGYIRSGWFGRVAPATGRTNFSPITGELDASVTAESNAATAYAAALYAIARGNGAAIAPYINATYSGVLAP